MAKPTEDYSWASDATAEEIQTPTVAQRTKGVERGSTWTRKRTNWMFHQWGKMLNWVRDFGMDTSKNLSDLADKAASRTNLGVLKSGTGNEETRTNLQNDARFVAGQKGTLAANFRNNGENDSRFVQHSEVINNLTSTDTDKPSSAAMAKALKDAVNTAQNSANTAQATANTKLTYSGTSDSGGRTNAQNDARYLLESNNLSDLTSKISAQSNIGIKNGTVNIGENSNVSLNLGSTVLGATVSFNTLEDLSTSCGCTWSGSTLNIRNSNGAGTLPITYIAIVG